MTWLRQTEAGVVINVRVVPRGSANRVEGPLGDALKIRLTAPPVEGKANKALVHFLADALGLPASRISLLSGERGRHKQVLVRGATETALKAKLGL
ncbi:MAG: YggU family protein [Kiritimatiellae bacterium]|nr:YggU family protein [Kiritimatiellia bacterium]